MYLRYFSTMQLAGNTSRISESELEHWISHYMKAKFEPVFIAHAGMYGDIRCLTLRKGSDLVWILVSNSKSLIDS